MGTSAAAAAAASTNASGAPTGRLYQGVERDGFGMRMLASMGWEEGKGVGKNGNGIAKHIRAKKRAMNSGIGADAKSDATGKVDWTLNAVSFDNILKGLSRAYASEDSDGDGVTKTLKTKRILVEASKATHKGQADEDEAALGKTSNEDAGRSTVGHAGRYQKRESQKNVKNYSAADLDAILGGISRGFADVPGTAAAERAVNANKRCADGVDSLRLKHDKEREESKELLKLDEVEKLQKKRMRVAKQDIEQSVSKSKKNAKEIKGRGTRATHASLTAEHPDSENPTLPAPPEDWWGWTVGFLPAGYMVETQVDHAQVAIPRRHGFNEADQERLAMAAHDGANRGKKGLGVGTVAIGMMTRQSGGSCEGKKTKFSEENGLGSLGALGSQVARTGQPYASLEKGNWGKLAVKIVTKAGGSMKIKELLKKLLKKATESERKSGSLEDEMHAELHNSSSIIMDATLAKLK